MGLAVGAHLRGLQPHFELEVERAAAAVGVAVQVGQRLRVARRPGEAGAERLERLQRHDPGRDGRGEVLRQERAERLVLPGLDVAGRPVVEQAQAEQVVFGLGHRHRLALRVGGADVDRHFQLVVEPLAGAEARGAVGARHAQLRHRPRELLARDADRRAAPVVADGHPLVVGQQRVVGAEHLADGGGVEDAGVEVGVVADAGGHRVFGLGLRHQGGLPGGLAGGARAQAVRQRLAQRHAGRAAPGHQRVEAAVLGAGQCGGGLAGELPRLHQRQQVDDLVADGRAGPERLGAAGAAEDAQRQVLDRKVGAVGVGAGHPALQGGVVGAVDSCGHGAGSRKDRRKISRPTCRRGGRRRPGAGTRSGSGWPALAAKSRAARSRPAPASPSPRAGPALR